MASGSVFATPPQQRTRWQRGLCETLWTHRSMLFNPRYGRIGFASLPQFLAFDVAAPLLETAGLLLMPLFFLLGLIQVELLACYFAVVSLFGVFCSMMSFLLAEGAFFRTTRRRDMILYGLAAIGENFGYRQLNALWRIEGIWQFVRGQRGWGEMTRRGFNKSPARTGGGVRPGEIGQTEFKPATG